jgi:predicted transcriptional regulator
LRINKSPSEFVKERRKSVNLTQEELKVLSYPQPYIARRVDEADSGRKPIYWIFSNSGRRRQVQKLDGKDQERISAYR